MRISTVEKLSAQDVFRMCAAEWKKMNPEQKQVYQAQAVGQEEYTKKMAAYRQSDEYAQFLKKKLLADKRKKLKEFELPGAPKRPRSAYIYFSMDKRKKVKAANPFFSVTQVTELIGAAWREINEVDKAVFEGLALNDKTRYTEEMKKYQETAKYRQMQSKKTEYLRSLKKTPKTKIDEKANDKKNKKELDSKNAKEKQRKISEAKAKKKIADQKKKEKERAMKAKLKLKAAEKAKKEKEKVKQHKAKLSAMEKELKTMLADAEKAKKKMQSVKFEVKKKQQTVKSSSNKGRESEKQKVSKVNARPVKPEYKEQKIKKMSTNFSEEVTKTVTTN